MEISIECGCGNLASGVADGDLAMATSLECVECEAMWAVTITNIRDGESTT
jgi:hypothetical protein